MPIITSIIGFVFYRIFFKLAFDQNISLVADLFLSVCLFIAASYITNIMGIKHGQNAFMQRLGTEETTMPTVRPFLHLCLISAVILGIGLAIIYGFSDRLFRAISRDDQGYFWASVFIVIPLIVYYIQIHFFFKRQLKQMESFEEE